MKNFKILNGEIPDTYQFLLDSIIDKQIHQKYNFLETVKRLELNDKLIAHFDNSEWVYLNSELVDVKNGKILLKNKYNCSQIANARFTITMPKKMKKVNFKFPDEILLELHRGNHIKFINGDKEKIFDTPEHFWKSFKYSDFKSETGEWYVIEA